MDYYSNHKLQKKVNPKTGKEELYIEVDNSIKKFSPNDINTKDLYPSSKEALAYQLATSYIANLNAEQLLQLFINFNIITKKQYSSLVIKYKDLDKNQITSAADSHFDSLLPELARQLASAKKEEQEEK